MESIHQSFHLEEFRQLKGEISTLLQRIEMLIKLSLFGGVAIYAWILIHVSPEVVSDTTKSAPQQSDSIRFLGYAGFLPPALLVFSAVMAWLTFRHVNVIADYLKRLEGLLGIYKYGWETHWQTKQRPMEYSLFGFLMLVLVIECAVSFYLQQHLAVLVIAAH
ncbi:hypothetical protein SFA35_05395 [Pseudomonas sp. HR96]|uniref:hypothetical protein n=1 Tax=Pseudomonas sp. HR96 TaxID=1027966 RepID=UPI002A758925|nr:hypothetical protein [Pseudomonas sp. HR96]WPP00810.1 hypothetical protein SFA35_05395 [Pseudomonas sp. HR96]